MLSYHKSKGAVATIAVIPVPWEETHRFGVMKTDDTGRITEFQEKPKVAKSNLASMGVYVFDWQVLRAYLEADEADPDSNNDFGKNIIPNMLAAGEPMYAYAFKEYWKDVGTVDSLWEANMDLLARSRACSTRPAGRSSLNQTLRRSWWALRCAGFTFMTATGIGQSAPLSNFHGAQIAGGLKSRSH